MVLRKSLVALAIASVGVLVAPSAAMADHASRPHTDNMHAKG